MLKLYYKIWVDTLVKIKSQSQNKDRWKFLSFIVISTAMALNFILVISIIQRNILGEYFYKIELDIFPGKKIDGLLEFILLFFVPVAVINYSLIFYNRKYEKLINKYNTYNGKLGITYLLTSFFLPLVLLILVFLFSKIF